MPETSAEMIALWIALGVIGALVLWGVFLLIKDEIYYKKKEKNNNERLNIQ